MASFGDFNKVNTNVTAMEARLSLNKINAELGNSRLKLSTGYKINNAEDDSAGFAIATKLRSRITGLEQALQNVSDAKSVMDIIEGGYSSIMDNLIEMKGLATQGANDTFSASERTLMAKQINALSTDINSGFNMVVTCLKQCIEGEVNMCHNHATLRAANMELVELFGRQWIGGVEEQHKNLACKYLQDAANVAGMYGSLKGKVSAMASGDEIQGDDLEAVPVAAKSYLLEEKIRKLIATDSLPVVEDVEPAKDGEEEKEPVELEDLVTASVDQRSILLYYMSLVQTRRVADAAMANDNKFSSVLCRLNVSSKLS